MGSVLPGVLGGDIVKAGYLFSYNKSFSKVKIASVLVFDRLFGIGAIIFWGAIFSLSFIVFRGGEVNLLSMTPVIFLLLGLLSFIAFRVAVRIVPDDKLPNLLRDLWSSFSTISDFKDLRYSIPVVASTLGAVFILLIGLATVGGILHTQVDGQSYFLIQLFLLSLSLFVSAIPITPLGVGVGQLTVSTVYAMYGLDPTVGVTVATIQQAGLLVVSVLIGGPAIFTIRKQ
jgi:uncharacterized membrane protein YbhN (UPF0104 family)